MGGSASAKRGHGCRDPPRAGEAPVSQPGESRPGASRSCGSRSARAERRARRGTCSTTPGGGGDLGVGLVEGRVGAVPGVVHVELARARRPRGRRSGTAALRARCSSVRARRRRSDRCTWSTASTRSRSSNQLCSKLRATCSLPSEVLVAVAAQHGQRCGGAAVAELLRRRAGRVDDDPVAEPGLLERLAQQELAHGRAADVAGADDDDAVRGGLGLMPPLNPVRARSRQPGRRAPAANAYIAAESQAGASSSASSARRSRRPPPRPKRPARSLGVAGPARATRARATATDRCGAAPRGRPAPPPGAAPPAAPRASAATRAPSGAGR